MSIVEKAPLNLLGNKKGQKEKEKSHEKMNTETFAKDRIEYSFRAVFFTALDYVLSDLRKKQKQFKIGVMTIFLVVGFVTFLDSLVQLAPAIFMMTSAESQGDFDLRLQMQFQENQATLSN